MAGLMNGCVGFRRVRALSCHLWSPWAAELGRPGLLLSGGKDSAVMRLAEALDISRGNML